MVVVFQCRTAVHVSGAPVFLVDFPFDGRTLDVHRDQPCALSEFPNQTALGYQILWTRLKNVQRKRVASLMVTGVTGVERSCTKTFR